MYCGVVWWEKILRYQLGRSSNGYRMRYVRYGALVGCAGSAWVQNSSTYGCTWGAISRRARVVLGYGMLSSHPVGVAVGRCLCSFYRVPPRVLSRFPGSRPLHRLCIFLLLRVLFLISDVSRELFSNGRRDARDTHRRREQSIICKANTYICA